MAIIKQRSGIHVVGENRAGIAKALSEMGFSPTRNIGQAGAVVVAESGATSARSLAMDALGRGQSVISSNPLLWALCGGQLSAAAKSQRLWLGMEGALLGSYPLQSWLAANAPPRLVAVFAGAADLLCQRLVHQAETPASAEAQLRLMRTPMDDLHGKHTQARAQIIAGLAYGAWHLPVRRQTLDTLEPQDITRLRRWGYVLRYGASITPQGIVAGPVALPADAPAATAAGNLLADDWLEPATMLAGLQPDAERALAGIRQDIIAWQERTVWTGHSVVPAPLAEGDGPALQTFYLRAPADRRSNLAATARVLEEYFDGAGNWQALLHGTLDEDAREFVALALPVAQTAQTAVAVQAAGRQAA